MSYKNELLKFPLTFQFKSLTNTFSFQEQNFFWKIKKLKKKKEYVLKKEKLCSDKIFNFGKEQKEKDA